MSISQQFIDDELSSEGVKSLVEKRPWMKYKKFELIDTIDALDRFVDQACEAKLCGVDTETSGLNSGPEGRGLKSKPCEIAGLCLSFNVDYGCYIPINHFNGRNLPVKLVMSRLQRIIECCITVYHNAKFDLEVLRRYGIILEDPHKYRDTLLGACVLWSNRKTKGLKALSKDFLGKEMIEIDELTQNKKNIDFRTIHPKDAVWYAASDPMCTLELYLYQQNLLDQLDPQGNGGLKFTYWVEHCCAPVVQEMERNLVLIDVNYYKSLAEEILARDVELETLIYEAAGGPFEFTSNIQLANVLFEKLGLEYPSEERSSTGGCLVNDEILEGISSKHPLPKLIQEYREIHKIYDTYVLKFINNVDENSCVKFQMNQTAADSGRFSASGGKGIEIDGYSGVNCQNIPAVKKNDHWKMRHGIKARPGFRIVTIDYSGEELRIATNLSKEPVWIKEFNEGSGDLHSITASLFFHSTPQEMAKPENKDIRGKGKTINFLMLYGGGARLLAERAKITVAEAQEGLDNFFSNLTKLDDWMKTEKIRARRRGYARTAFGRRRPLKEMYDSGDRKLMSLADRLATNAAIQGTGADIIKIALFRVWDYIRKNNLCDDIKILFPIHDEIVYEMREDKLDLLIPAIAEIMKIRDLTKQIGWAVGLEVDAEYDRDLTVHRNYFDDLKLGITASISTGLSDDEYTALKKEIKENGPDALEKYKTMNFSNSKVESGPEFFESKKEKDSDISKTEEVNTTEKKSILENVKHESSPEPSQEQIDAYGKSKFYNFEVCKSDLVAKTQTNMIWDVLKSTDPYCKGVKKYINLTKDKKVLYTSDQPYSIEGFINLAYCFGV